MGMFKGDEGKVDNGSSVAFSVIVIVIGSIH